MTVYTTRWRDQIRPGVQASADVIVPLLAGRYQPASVVDVGCGEGWWCRRFEQAGVGRVVGVDGPWVAADVTVDLDRPPYPNLGRFDLAVCLEVAEHVAASHADRLVAWLVSLAPIVVFSAAVPGQGGEGHVNEQPPGYWAGLFATHGYGGSGALRQAIWDDDRVSWWYRQNLLVFGDPDLPADGCPHVLHPQMLTWRRRR